MNFFRKHLESKITKTIALFFAIIFVGWEFISSMLQQENHWLIKVGDVEYTARDWQENYQHFTQDPLSAQEAMVNPKYVKQRVLDEMIRDALILQEAGNAGLQVNDKMAASEIIHMKAFQNEEKKFDKNKLETFLAKNNMSEVDFIRTMKDNILRNQLMDIFYNTSGIMSIPTFNLLLKLITAEQNITLYKVPLVFDSTEPSDIDLKQFMEQNSHNYMTEDQAEISKLIFTQDLVKVDAVSEKEIEDYYSSNTIIEPEQRIVNQIVISSYNEAKQLLDNIRSNKITYDEAAKLYKDNQMIPYEIGPFKREEFDEEISKNVFTLSVNQVSDLIQTPLGWHIFRVNKIYPEKKKDIYLIKDTIIKNITEQKYKDKMNKLIEEVTSDINAKLSINDIASKYNLNIIHTSEKSKRLSNGMLDLLPISDDMLEDGISKKRMITAAFLDDHEIKLLGAKDNKSFILLTTDSIIPGHLMKFDDIKIQLIEQYKKYKSNQTTEALAKEYRKALIEKKDIDKLESFKLKISKTKSNNQVPNCINKLINDMNQNGIFDGITVPCMEGQNYFFTELQAIDFSVPVSDEEKISLRQPILSLYNEMIFNQFLAQLKHKYKVELDERFIRYLNE